MIPENLVEITRELVRSRPAYLTLAELATKIEEKQSWLEKFMERRGPKDPATSKIVKLYNYLVALKNDA